jgi:signal peptidase I
MHWKAMPSPIGLSDRGDYRRTDDGNVDVITSNGYIYYLAGTFTATLVGNSRDQKRSSDSALIDYSQGYLILPRFYDCKENENKKRIRITPGDRIYCDPEADDLVINKELMTYSFDKDNIPMYPIMHMDGPIIDSKNAIYKEHIDFSLTKEGNIRWIPGGKNPGINPDTGEGNVYSLRYLYRAFYYITHLPNEVRITNITQGSERGPQRLPYHAIVVREYIFHNINKGDQTNKPPLQKMEYRQIPRPTDNVQVNQPVVSVEMTDINNDE